MITKLRDIVNGHQAETFTWPDGSELLVDVQTANALLTLYEALSIENQQFMAFKLEESKDSFGTTVEFAWNVAK